MDVNGEMIALRKGIEIFWGKCFFKQLTIELGDVIGWIFGQYLSEEIFDKPLIYNYDFIYIKKKSIVYLLHHSLWHF